MLLTAQAPLTHIINAKPEASDTLQIDLGKAMRNRFNNWAGVRIWQECGNLG
jgi:hypothetical protein